jgi:2,3-bisphosphoglycerate-dependent phosphoglycerate mutase
MVRHAQSQWNRENRFTGWADPPLTENGVAEAKQAAEALRTHGYRFDAAYSSRLQRATATCDLLLEGIGEEGVPCYQDWRLNERHYGALQGLDKEMATKEVGEHQVWRWRRGYVDRAEPLAPTHPDHPRNDPRYADVDPDHLPAVENLAETRARVTQFWNQVIVPQIKRRKRLLISAHGNTLRALIMKLSGMTIAEVETFEIPTATPIIYHFNRVTEPLGWGYLGDDDIDLAMSA